MPVGSLLLLLKDRGQKLVHGDVALRRSCQNGRAMNDEWKVAFTVVVFVAVNSEH